MNNWSLKGKKALVTGGTKVEPEALGRGTARGPGQRETSRAESFLYQRDRAGFRRQRARGAL